MNWKTVVWVGITVSVGIFSFSMGYAILEGDSASAPTDNDHITVTEYNLDGNCIQLSFRDGDIEGLQHSHFMRELNAAMFSHHYITVDDPVLISLVEQIDSISEGMDRDSKAELMLRFVQDNIRYHSDMDNWGIPEYYQYPVETLYYGKGDCEDMAALLYTMYRIAGMDALMVKGESHIAVGVAMDECSGIDVTPALSNERFYLAEPTGDMPVGSESLSDIQYTFNPEIASWGYVFMVLAIILFFLTYVTLREEWRGGNE